MGFISRSFGFTNGLMSESMIIWFLLVFMEIGAENEELSK